MKNNTLCLIHWKSVHMSYKMKIRFLNCLSIPRTKNKGWTPYYEYRNILFLFSIHNIFAIMRKGFFAPLLETRKDHSAKQDPLQVCILLKTPFRERCIFIENLSFDDIQLKENHMNFTVITLYYKAKIATHWSSSAVNIK